MTIEIRQMLIKSVVGDEPLPSDEVRETSLSPEVLQRLRAEILAECQALVALRLRDQAER